MNEPGIALETQTVLNNSDIVDIHSGVPITTGISSKMTSFQRVTLSEGSHMITLNSRTTDGDDR